ncbi:hypothetical protein K4H03_26940, partial [Mycobacterium tuberculosis]|nr:hypothetical protein [Mycobacterium tuberculosis]
MQFSFIVKTVIGWAAIAGVITLVVINKDRILDQLQAIGASSGLTDPAPVTGVGSVRIRLSPDGHFWARATINGVERRM